MSEIQVLPTARALTVRGPGCSKKRLEYCYLPGFVIEDDPLYHFRSLQIDFARQPETLQTIKKWIIRLAQFKMSKFGLYVENTYRYRFCPETAPDYAKNQE